MGFKGGEEQKGTHFEWAWYRAPRLLSGVAGFEAASKTCARTSSGVI
jgi:hypothetical protein